MTNKEKTSLLSAISHAEGMAQHNRKFVTERMNVINTKMALITVGNHDYLIHDVAKLAIEMEKFYFMAICYEDDANALKNILNPKD